MSKRLSGNKRNFMKNYVRTVDADDVLFFHGMNRVLPKESERGQIDSIRLLTSYL